MPNSFFEKGGGKEGKGYDVGATSMYTVSLFYSSSLIMRDELRKRTPASAPKGRAAGGREKLPPPASGQFFFDLYMLFAFEHEMETNADILFSSCLSSPCFQNKQIEFPKVFIPSFATAFSGIPSGALPPCAVRSLVSSSAQILLVYGAPYLFISSPRHSVISCVPLFVMPSFVRPMPLPKSLTSTFVFRRAQKKTSYFNGACSPNHPLLPLLTLPSLLLPSLSPFMRTSEASVMKQLCGGAFMQEKDFGDEYFTKMLHSFDPSNMISFFPSSRMLLPIPVFVFAWVILFPL
jgi:hypothetical protein